MSKVERLFDMEETVPVSNAPEWMIEPRPEGTLAPATNDVRLEEDFKRSRELLDSTAVTAVSLLEAAAEVAKSAQDPKSFDAATRLVEAVNNLALNMTKIHGDLASITKTNPQTQTVNTKNAIFVGSTKDLLAAIKEQKANA